ncbi:four helix bundle protein [Limnoraphis robusta Tam1]|uniref:four helix bundle protein n=1 Tax=Limnoraphis robusta TaxID=1118279 RepID=UPI002B204C78|nr:four helix bundle protein [Limnoraphis robusta]MEA5500135.1 four helix bundle protein [Limnoraphis robusta BA-68 BA1]MEA5541103.1 four helix bundle protein [Limnoraphis robusta Tam1]
MINSKVYDKAYKFAIRMVKAYKYLCEDKKEFVLSKQLLRSGTSIGANIAEANGEISKAEFSAKMSIAYKECLETKYWLCLLKDTDYLTKESFDSVYADVEELSKMLFSIVKSSRIIND